MYLYISVFYRVKIFLYICTSLWYCMNDDFVKTDYLLTRCLNAFEK